MISLNIPILIPAYMCRHPSFNSFVIDLKSHGISRVIILVDFDPCTTSYEAHCRDIRDLRRYLCELSCSHSVKIKLLSNILLNPHLYKSADFSSVAKKNFNCCFITLPLFSYPDISMQNIFVVKNAGFTPIINAFDENLVTYPKAFCESLVATENISFVFDISSITQPHITASIRSALTANNSIIFSASHLTASLIDYNIAQFLDSLDNRVKMHLAYSSRRLINRFY